MRLSCGGAVGERYRSAVAHQTDADRSGDTAGADLLRVIDLLNGAGEYPVFNGQRLP